MLLGLSAVPNSCEVRGQHAIISSSGMIESIFYGSRERDEAQQLKIRANVQLQGIQRNFYQTRFNLQIGERRAASDCGASVRSDNLGERTPVGLHDFYFAGDQPTDSSDFMSCSDEAVPDDPPPGRHENPGCQHWFALPELSATVQITYRRRHLAEWQEIKRKVRTLILSWKSNDGSGKQ